MGERLAFLPSVGFVGLLVGVLNLVIKNRRAYFFATGAIVALFAFLTFSRLPVWRDNATLFQQTIIDNPKSPKAYYNYGVQLYLNEKNIPEAERYFRKALEIHPTYILAARVMADIMLAQKDWGRLEYWYRYIIKLNPEDQEVKKNLDNLTNWRLGNSPNTP